MFVLPRLLRILDPVLSVIEIVVAILLFCRRLPVRERFHQRLLVVLAIALAALGLAVYVEKWSRSK